MNKPNFFAILPADVRYDKELSSTAKLLYAEITSLANKEGYCWATNKYFAELYDLSETQISLTIKQLQERGYLFVEIEKENGNKRKIWITPLKENLKTSLRKLKDPSLRKLKDPPAEKSQKSGLNKGENENNQAPNNINKNNKNNTIIESNTNKEIHPIKESFNSKEIIISEKDLNFLISLFREVNPSYQKLYSNKTQRKALERIVKTFGREETEKIIRVLKITNEIQYAPVITTPLELLNKIGRLMAFVKRQQKGKKEKRGIYVAFADKDYDDLIK